MTNNTIITCDRQGDILRAAVWRGRELRDIYLDDARHPDLTGAIVGGKVARVVSGQKSAYVDCGLGEMVFVSSADGFSAGEVVTLRIKTASRQGKAFGGEVIGGKPSPLGGRVGWVGVTQEHNFEVSAKPNHPPPNPPPKGGGLSSCYHGIITPPQPAWQRAIIESSPSAITFSCREDYVECERWLNELSTHQRGGVPSPLRGGLEPAPRFLAGQRLILHPLSKSSPHPELDDIIDTLLQPIVTLSGGSGIVIESTEALISVDVNGGESGNALSVNLLAVREIARQIRLRNLGGIIVVDALKMKQRADNAKVLNALNRAVADDPAGVQVFGMTKLGLIEMTRTRRGHSVAEIMGSGGHV